MHRLGLRLAVTRAGCGESDPHADDDVHVVETLARIDGRRATTHGATGFAAGLLLHRGQVRPCRNIPSRRHRRRPPQPGRNAQDDANPDPTLRFRPECGARPAGTGADGAASRVRTAAAGAQVWMTSSPGCAPTGCWSVPGSANALPGRSTGTPSPSRVIRLRRATRLLRRRETRPGPTLPRLQRRWELASAGTGGSSAAAERLPRPAAKSPSSPGSAPHARRSERARIWEKAIGAAARATRQVSAAALSDPAAAGDAAWAAADFLAATARVVEAAHGARSPRPPTSTTAPPGNSSRHRILGTPGTSCAARPGCCSPPVA